MRDKTLEQIENDKARTKRELQIEAAIYAKADTDSAFAIAYAIIQLASNLHAVQTSIDEIAFQIMEKVDKE